MAYDEPPTLEQLRADAIANFKDHPAIKSIGATADLEIFIDSIGNGDLDVSAPPCGACSSLGFLLADKEGQGKLSIERCDSCQRFASDNDATKHAYDLARNALA